MAADEAVGGGSKGEGEAEEVVKDSSGGGIKYVGKHDVHGVLGAYGSSAEHGEAELHGKDQVSREEKVRGINGIAGVGEGGGDGGKL